MPSSVVLLAIALRLSEIGDTLTAHEHRLIHAQLRQRSLNETVSTAKLTIETTERAE